jgi:tetratricopeptide (TPR) repeat protein
VRRLLNRRFIPFYFDLLPGGAAGDREARQFVVKVRPDLGGMGVATPPVLILSPLGKVVAEADNYSTEDALYETLRKILRENPKWNRPSEEEVRIEREAEEGRIESLLPAAEQILDLGEIERARAAYDRALAKLPPGSERDRAAYGLGHALRLAGDFEEMERAFARIEGRGSWAEDLSIERAHALFCRGEFDDLRRALAPFQARPPTIRGAEALYLLGLALFHSGDAEGAKALWRHIIETQPEGPWVHRSDWAIFDLEQGGKRTFSTLDERTPLGRIGYMGRKNPDLAPRGRRSGT